MTMLAIRPLLRAKLLPTKPGWKQLAVTSLPASRRASSCVKRMLASFDCAVDLHRPDSARAAWQVVEVRAGLLRNS